MVIPKVEIKKILYPTDLSQSARYAFAYAVSLAVHYQASITLLHVLYEAPEFVSSIIGTDKLAEIKRQQYEDAREALIGKRRENVIVTEIHGGFAGAMIGSTARRIVRLSPIPVFTIRLPQED